MVLFMSNFHSGTKLEYVKRKRPAGTGKGNDAVRKAFGQRFTMWAEIPDFIPQYNHNMNGVDIGDQLRKSFSTLRKCFKTWKPLWHFLLDLTTANSFLLSAWSPKDDDPAFEKQRNDRRAHYAFQKALYIGLLQEAIEDRAKNPPQPPPAPIRQPLPNRVEGSKDISEHHIQKVEKYGECSSCQAAKRWATKREARKALQELSNNSVINKEGAKARKKEDRPPRSLYKCDTCDIYLCGKGDCWKEHLLAVQEAREIQELQEPQKQSVWDSIFEEDEEDCGWPDFNNVEDKGDETDDDWIDLNGDEATDD